MSDNLILRKGKLANLADADYIPGALSITTDERAMYLDLDTETRVRLGDFIQVDSIADLTTNGDLHSPDLTHGDFLPWSPTAFYYAIAENALLKWHKEGGYWVQVNEKGGSGDVTSDQLNTLYNVINELTGRIDAKQDEITLEPDRVVITNNQGKLTFSNITPTTLSYLDITSSLQETLNAISSSLSALEAAIGSEETRATKAEAQIREDFAAADSALKDDITRAYKNYLDNQLQVADAMQYKGVITSPEELGVTGNDAGEKVQAGWTYKAGSFFILPLSGGASQYVYTGDLLIAHSDQGEEDETYLGVWDHVSSGYEDDNDVRFHIETEGEDGAETPTGAIDLISVNGSSRGKLVFNTDSTQSNVVAEITSTSLGGDSSGITQANIDFKIVWGQF